MILFQQFSKQSFNQQSNFLTYATDVGWAKFSACDLNSTSLAILLELQMMQSLVGLNTILGVDGVLITTLIYIYKIEMISQATRIYIKFVS